MKRKILISRTFCYLGFLLMFGVSVYLRDIFAGTFAGLCFLMFHFSNLESDFQDRNYKQFRSLK